MGVPARPYLPATGPGRCRSGSSCACTPARASRRWSAAPALGPARRAAPLAADSPVPPAVAAGARAGRALGVPRPGALAARPARPAGGARAGDGSGADGKDRVPGRRDPALPRPGHLHDHEGRRVRPDRRGPRVAGPGARVQPAAHRRHRLDVRVVAGRGCEDPARAMRRADAFAFAVSREGVEDGTFWSSKASDYLRGFFHAAALGGYDMRVVAAWVSGADPRVPERILTECRSAPVGADAGRAPLRGAQDRRHRPRGDVAGLSFMADPALAASVLPAPGRRVRHRHRSWPGRAPPT